MSIKRLLEHRARILSVAGVRNEIEGGDLGFRDPTLN
jgi:hypothetical protein